MKLFWAFILLFITACESKQSYKNQSKLLEVYKSKNDTIKLGPKAPIKKNPVNMFFLRDANYEKAKKVCGNPKTETHFVLNEKPIVGIRKMVIKAFTKRELSLPITIKEIQWDNGDKNYIMVYYKVIDENWEPFYAFSYRKTMEYTDEDFENISPKEE